MNSDRLELNKKIIDLMNSKGLSYRDMEKETGISRSTIQRYVTTQDTKFPIDNLEDIAKALNVDPAYLMGWEEKEENTIYGNHQKNLEYFADKPEMLELYNEINNSESLQLLFDSARDLEPQDLETVLMIIKGIKSERNRG